MPMVKPQQISAEDYLGENTQISADEYLADEQPSRVDTALSNTANTTLAPNLLNIGKILEGAYAQVDKWIGKPRSPYATEPPTANEQTYEQTTGGDPRARLGNFALRAGSRLAGGTVGFFPQILASLIAPQTQGAESRADAAKGMVSGAVESMASTLPNVFDLGARMAGVQDPSALLPQGWQATHQDLVNKAYQDPSMPIVGAMMAEGGVKMGRGIQRGIEGRKLAKAEQARAAEEAAKQAEMAAEEAAFDRIVDESQAGNAGRPRYGMPEQPKPQEIASGAPIVDNTAITGGMKPMPRDNVLAPRTGDPTLDLAISSGAPKTDLPAYDSPGVGQPRANVVQNPRGGGMPVSLDIRQKAQPIFGSTANPTSPKMQVQMNRGVSEISPTVPKTEPVASVQGGGKESFAEFNARKNAERQAIRDAIDFESGSEVTLADGRKIIISKNIDPSNSSKYPYRATYVTKDGMPSGHDVFKSVDEVTQSTFAAGAKPENIISAATEARPQIKVGDDVIWTSPYTGDTPMNYRGDNGGNAVLFNPKSGMQVQVPKEQIRSVSTPPSPVGKAKRGGGLDATIVPVAGAGLGAAAIYSALSDEDKNFVKAGIGEGFSGLGMLGLAGAMLVGGKKPSEYLKAKGIKTPSGGSFRPTIEAVSTAVGGDVLMGMRQVQTPLSGSESVVRAKNTVGEVVKNFTPAIYSIAKLGKGAKELFYDPVVSGLNVVTREAKPAQLAFRSLLKEAGIGIRNYGDVSKKIATFAIAQQKNGIEILKGMGITEIPKLTPQELTVYKYMRQQYEALHPRLNQARKAAGLREIGYTDDYFTFARNMEDWLQSGQAIDGGKLFIEGQETIPLADQTAAGFTKSRGTSTAQLQLDAFGTFESYLNSAVRHIHLTPLLAEQARMLTKNYGTAKNPWYLKDQNPGAYMELRDWINQQAGYQLPQRSQILSGAVSRFTQRMVRAGLSFNVQSMVIQPTAYANFVAQHGAKWGAEGAKVLFDEKLRQMVMDKSRVLYGREHDISVTRGREGQIGVLGRVAERVGDVGMNPLQKLDLLTAEATWYGAYQKALKEMKLPENKAIIYADDIVTKTQGSASTADIAPIQRTPWGKALTAYNTFTINNINWLARELPGSGSKLSQTGRVGRYLLGTMLINYAYEQAGFNSPIPNPISAFASAMGDDKKNPFQESLKETIGMFPVVGGASQYGSSSLGATSQLLDDMIGVGTGQKGARATVQTAGKLLGIPGTTQAAKLLFPYNEKK